MEKTLIERRNLRITPYDQKEKLDSRRMCKEVDEND